MSSSRFDVEERQDEDQEDLHDDDLQQEDVRRGSWFGRLLKLLILLAIGLVLLAQLFYFMQVVFYRWYDPPTSALMRQQATVLAALDPPKSIKHEWVPYDKISRYAKEAVVAAEDSGFMDHGGIEWEAIERAYRVNAQAGVIAQGGSTITMQLAKNLFLSTDRSYIRKAQEIAIALMIELVLDKRRILELYLNMVEFGQGVFGIEAAARHYFNTSAAKLTRYQAAWLASILPAPRRYDKNRNSAWIERKTRTVMQRMNQVSIP